MGDENPSENVDAELPEWADTDNRLIDYWDGEPPMTANGKADYLLEAVKAIDGRLNEIETVANGPDTRRLQRRTTAIIEEIEQRE